MSFYVWSIGSDWTWGSSDLGLCKSSGSYIGRPLRERESWRFGGFWLRECMYSELCVLWTGTVSGTSTVFSSYWKTPCWTFLRIRGIRINLIGNLGNLAFFGKESFEGAPLNGGGETALKIMVFSPKNSQNSREERLKKNCQLFYVFGDNQKLRLKRILTKTIFVGETIS